MLRIQRHPRSQEVTLVMGHRAPMLQSRTLWVALAIALTIHLAALLLFRFPILKVNSLSQAPITMVELEQQPEYQETQAGWLPHHANELLPRDLLIERRHTPPSPTWKAEAKRSKAATSLSKGATPAFRQAENLEALFLPTQQARHLAANTIQVHVSGPLANYKLLNNGIGIITIDEEEQSLRYSVKLDAETGQIAWFTLASSTFPTTNVSAIAEKILKAMRFNAPDTALFPSGEVEIVFVNVPGATR